uniref:Uncharacterized protein n=1 Tax=Arundo donax TaxID=35708 RepID=A0A0A9EW34_ARUDO
MPSASSPPHAPVSVESTAGWTPCSPSAHSWE